MVAGDLLLDTNVLIYALNANRASAVSLVLETEPAALAISTITWMEVLAGAVPAAERGTREFLANFQALETTREIAERAATIRRSTRVKLPDAIIYATALVSRRTLVTYNIRDFPTGSASVYHPPAD